MQQRARRAISKPFDLSPYDMSDREFNAIVEELGHTPQSIAGFLGKSTRQCERYSTGAQPVPESVARHLQLILQLKALRPNRPWPRIRR